MSDRRTIISTQTQRQAASLSMSAAKKRTAKRKKSALKPSVVALYASVFIAAVVVIAASYRSPESSIATTSVGNTQTSQSKVSDTSVNEVVATSIAANVAEAANLPVATNVANLSVSLAAKNEVTTSNDASVSKQQIVQPTASRRELITYVAKSGDTVDAVAKQYGISKDTVKWANNLTSDTLDEGKELTVPPVDGVVYTVKEGDTVEKIAEKYKASEDRIVAFNDLELQGLEKDGKIVIPAGELPETERPGYVAPRATTSYQSSNSGTAAVNPGFQAGSVGNRYAYGWCTWYAYERRAAMGRPVGSFWGNANTWVGSAQRAGYATGKTVRAGAVFQTNAGGYGHVGIIDSVDYATGTVTYSDMNGLAGWGRVGRGTVTIAEAEARWTFIY